MKYALGNMLNGAGGLNADGLSLDLQFATDKTLTARKGPTPTFTRASTATFVGSDGLIQSAAINAARFDHDPITLACKGLLIEESRTNLVVQSENFGTTWLPNQTSLTLNNIAAPDGLITADRLNEDISVANHQIVQSLGSLTAAQPYTFSVFAKAATHTTFQMTVSTAAFGSNIFANFILTGSGSIGNSSGATARIEGYLDGWYRCSISINSVTGGTGGFVQIASNNNNSASARLPSYLGTNAQIVNLWGAQLEAGAFPTSYIPTTTASVVRSGDLCSITGSDFTGFYNQSEGTIVGSGLTNQLTSNAGPELFRSSDGTNNNRIQFGMTNVTGQAVRPFITASGTTTYSSNQGTATVGVERKVGIAYKTNDTISAFNGTLGTLDTTVTPPTNCNQVALFSGLGSGTISSLRYFKKRLSNTKLQTLTT